MRLPACVMGTLSIGIIALMGRRLFNWRVGLFAAFVYACMPLNIRWAQNAFYLSQCAVHVDTDNLVVLRGNKSSSAAPQVSDRRFGRVLPGLSVLGGKRLSSARFFHCVDRCSLGRMVVVKRVSSLPLPLLHGCRGRRSGTCSRTIAGIPYLMVGSGLSNVAGPSLFFLTPAYTPEFYIDKLWLSENHVFFTIMIFLGLPFCWAQRGFRYVFTVLVMLWFLHTNFLAALSPRYCYYYQPLVILAGTAAAMTLYDRVVSLAHRAGNSTVARVAAHATGLAVLTLLFLQSNESLMKEYTLSSKGDATDTHDSHEYVPIRLPRRGGVCKESLPAGRPDCARHSTRVRVLRGNARRLRVGYSSRLENRV